MKIDIAVEYLNRIISNNKGVDGGRGYVEAAEMAISALRAQQEAEKNEPLTLDDLQEMGGQPVWAILELDGMGQIHAYAIVDLECECVKGLNCFLLFEDYGAWFAYRRPPKEKEK